MFRSAAVGGDEGQVDVGRLRGRQLLLGLLGGFSQPLQSHGIFAEIDPLLRLEPVGDVVDQLFIEIVAAQVRVSVGAQDLDQLIADFEDRNVERSAAEVEDDDLLVLLLLQTIGERRRRRFVDDAFDLQAGNLTGILGRLPLGVVEVGRCGDHRLVDLVTEVAFGGFLQLPQDQRGDFRRRVLFAAGFDLHVVGRTADHRVRNDLLLGLDLVVTASHESLDRVDRVRRIGDGLTFGRFAHQRLTLIGECNHAWRNPIAFQVGDHLRLASLYDRDDRVGGAQVNSDHLFALNRHYCSPICSFVECSNLSSLEPRLGQSDACRHP